MNEFGIQGKGQGTPKKHKGVDQLVLEKADNSYTP